jgi:hypothetical protein
MKTLREGVQLRSLGKLTLFGDNMAIQSVDQLYAAFSAGQTDRQDWNKITGGAAYTAGRSYETFSLGGYPPPTTFPGTALAWRGTDDATGDGTTRFGIPHGGNVSALIKHLSTMAAWSTAATGVPAVLKLVDLQGYYPGINMNLATAQTFTGTPAMRYTNGVRAALAIRTSSGATAHNLAMSYTNQASVAGRTMPVTVACTVSAITPHICHSGTATNNYGPELPLASGDTGILSVQSVTLSAASLAGTAVLMLYKPLANIPLSIASLMTEKDFWNQLPSAPQIKDGACLGFILMSGAAVAAATTFSGANETVWG